jgi:UrcA family protein
MTRFLIASLAAVLSTTASANISAVRIEGNTAHIGYSDLDLQSHADRTELAGRIRDAANRICALPDDGLQPLARSNECYRIAVTSGVEQMEAAAGAKHRN